MPQRYLFDKKTLDALKKHPLYSQDGKGDAAVAYARIFNPYGRGAWYITEYDGEDTMFGYYREDDSHEQTAYDTDDEYGYVSKSELENARVRVGGMSMPLERDTLFEGATIGAIKKGHADVRIGRSAMMQPRFDEATITTNHGGGADTSSKATNG